MRFIHYHDHLVTEMLDSSQIETSSCLDKPRGLWFCPAGDSGWTNFVRRNLSTSRISARTEIVVSKTANIAKIASASDLYSFGEFYGVDVLGGLARGVDWRRVALDYEGILITPYLEECRLAMHSIWYYGWDCASGCVWRKSAVEKLVEYVP